MTTVTPSTPLCIRCNYSLAQLPDAICPECGMKFDFADPSTFNATGRPLGSVSRFLLASPPWPATIITAVVLAFSLWNLREPQTSMIAEWFFGWYFTCTLLLGIRALQLLARRMTVDTLQARPFAKRLRCRWPAWPFLSLAIVLASVAAEHHWPLMWAFTASRSSLDSLAQRALAQPSKTAILAPTSTGILRIDSIEIYDGQVVVIYTATRDGSKWGFMRIPGCDKDEFPLDYFAPGNKFHMQRARRLSGDWFLLFDAYWAVKVGWS